jgi:hypothetical protein
MKKVVLVLIVAITMSSCSSDDSDSPSSDKVLTKIERTFNNTGNTATINFNDDKVTSFYYNETILTNELVYNGQDKMTSFTLYNSVGDLKSEYVFTYDNNGNLSSVHDYEANPLFTYEPENQDRVVTWNDNTMSIPLLVDIDSNRYDNYEFTFNSDDLLTKYKVTEWDNDIAYNVDFEYDNNKNIIRMSGFYEVFGIVNFDYELTYDDKINPRHNHYNKYYINNLIIYGGRQDSGFLSSALLSTIFKFGLNNPLVQDTASTDPNLLYFTYDYDGDYPTTSYYRSQSTVATTSNFVYE